MEFGSQAFSSHVIDLKDNFEKKEAITLVTSQFLSFQDFAEKVNILLIALFSIIDPTSIEDLMVNVNRVMSPIFMADNVHLWMSDAETGFYYTINRNGSFKRCL